HAEENGYTLVLTYSKSNPTVLYVDKKLDITAQVIDALNKEYKDKNAKEKKQSISGQLMHFQQHGVAVNTHKRTQRRGYLSYHTVGCFVFFASETGEIPIPPAYCLINAKNVFWAWWPQNLLDNTAQNKQYPRNAVP